MSTFLQTDIAEVSVTWFGEFKEGDFATLNTATLQKAFNTVKVKGGTIKIPIGVYKMLPFELPSNVTLSGGGITNLPFFTGGDVTQQRTGTVLLFTGQVGVSDILFAKDIAGFNRNSGIKNMSIYHDDTVAIKAIVCIGDVSLYPVMEDVQIGCTTISPGSGLLIEGSTLYGNFRNVQVNGGQIGHPYETSVKYALHLKSTADLYVPNANTFLGGHFIGKQKSLFVEATSDRKVFGIQFLGTSFECEYSSEVEVEYLADASYVNGAKASPSLYAFKWITVQAASGMNFAGCYFELGGYPATYDDGVNGVLDTVPCIELGQYTTYIDIKNVVPISRVLDRGFLNMTSDAIRFANQNNSSVIKAIPEGAISTLQFFSNTPIPQGEIADLTLTNISAIIKGYVELLQLPADGNPAEDYFLLYHPADKRVVKATRAQAAATLQEVLEKGSTATVGMQVGTLMRVAEGNFWASKTGGSQLKLSDENNEITIESLPIGGATQMVIKVNTVECARFNQNGKLALQQAVVAASADTANAPGASYDQAEVQAILTELRDLKTKLRNDKILAT